MDARLRLIECAYAQLGDDWTAHTAGLLTSTQMAARETAIWVVLDHLTA